MNEKKIIVALDNNNILKTLELVEEIKNEVNSFKIGYEFFFNFGIEGYNQIKKISSNIFLDLKLHDIPNTVEKGIKAISKLKPKFTTIHIAGGDEMMRASLLKKKKTREGFQKNLVLPLKNEKKGSSYGFMVQVWVKL